MISCHPDPFRAFIADLQIEGCDVHLYKGANTFGMTIEDAIEKPDWLPWWDTENVYFLAGVKPGLTKRAADSDVLMRGMFTLDFDIRKELEKKALELGVVKTPMEIDESGFIQRFGNEIIDRLSRHAIYKDFRYVVFSGNGMHVHYFGDPVQLITEDQPGGVYSEKEAWAAGMKVIFDEVNAFAPIPCDTGVGNASRIMRMPGSWNLKDPHCKKPVDFEIWMPGVSVPPLKFVLDKGRFALAEQEKRKEQERADFAEQHPEGGSGVIDLINSIPIEQVVQQLLGCTVSQHKKDGGLRFVDETGAERGFFKHKEFNIVVHEGTSLFPAPEGRGYNCLGLAKVVKGLSAHDAIEWFAERSARVRDEIVKEKQEWSAGRARKEVEFVEKHYAKPL